MYQPDELAAFAISEFQRGLEGLTEDEARTRLEKADGSAMNAIAWTVAHIAGHWLNRPQHLDRYAPGSKDGPPPALAEADALLEQGRAFAHEWVTRVGDDVFASKPEALGGESVGTALLRAVLHTWFHAGEINAVRQQLGHPEIGFVGDIRGKLEWRSSPDGFFGNYRPHELSRFAIAEFERGVEGLTDDEARVRLEKSDGTRMNAISWVIGHIATHWHWDAFLLAGDSLPEAALTFFGQSADPTPRPLGDMLALFDDARVRTERWLPNLTDELLASKRDVGPQADENLGTQLMRAVLHTWFHIGEINAIRQLLGHEEQPHVGTMLGRLEWRPAAG